jgi:SAM-dependent methyltransferase
MSAESFDADWLALREPVDHRSRAPELVTRLTDWWEARGCSRVLDLGSGTGSNLRYLAPRLPGNQEWTLLDHDPALLARIKAPATTVRISTIEGDLAGPGLTEVRHAHLVTASALLDLVSETWLGSLAEACSEGGSAALFTLTYDGTIEWASTDGSAGRTERAGDQLVRDSVNAHQLGNKGLGPALGPSAGPAVERIFRDLGYQTWMLASPWRLGSKDAELASALVVGWAAAAAEERPDSKVVIEEWAAHRQASIVTGNFHLTVGHQDLLALPDNQVAESP